MTMIIGGSKQEMKPERRIKDETTFNLISVKEYLMSAAMNISRDLRKDCKMQLLAHIHLKWVALKLLLSPENANFCDFNHILKKSRFSNHSAVN